MTAVYALYTTGDAAQRAVNSLRAAGYADRDITIISAAPMEDYEFSHIGRESYVWYFATGGAILGFLVATWLTMPETVSSPEPISVFSHGRLLSAMSSFTRLK